MEGRGREGGSVKRAFLLKKKGRKRFEFLSTKKKLKKLASY